METEIFLATTDADIKACFSAFSVLRPNVVEKNFLPQVRRQYEQGYRILALRHDRVVKSAAGFRLAEYLAWGKVLYVDDLTTLPGAQSRGYGGTLLDWLIKYANDKECNGLHLDSGYTRHAAHRLYLRKGLQLTCHHFAMEL